MRKTSINPLALLAVLLATTLSIQAKVHVPSVFADHMVLQRGVPVPVWGWADAGEDVTVEFAGQKKSVKADADGKWLVKLAALTASADSRALKISGKSSGDTQTITDVLVGDVWLAGGQSNMGFPLNSAHNAAEVLPLAEDSQLRFFLVKTKTAAEPQRDGVGTWNISTPATAKTFPASPISSHAKFAAIKKFPSPCCRPRGGGRTLKRGLVSPDSNNPRR